MISTCSVSRLQDFCNQENGKLKTNELKGASGDGWWHSLGLGTRRPETGQNLGPGTSQDFTAAVPGLFVHYSAMHKHRLLNYLNLAMISESLTL